MASPKHGHPEELCTQTAYVEWAFRDNQDDRDKDKECGSYFISVDHFIGKLNHSKVEECYKAGIHQTDLMWGNQRWRISLSLGYNRGSARVVLDYEDDDFPTLQWWTGGPEIPKPKSFEMKRFTQRLQGDSLPDVAEEHELNNLLLQMHALPEFRSCYWDYRRQKFGCDPIGVMPFAMLNQDGIVHGQNAVRNSVQNASRLPEDIATLIAQFATVLTVEPFLELFTSVLENPSLCKRPSIEQNAFLGAWRHWARLEDDFLLDPQLVERVTNASFNKENKQIVYQTISKECRRLMQANLSNLCCIDLYTIDDEYLSGPKTPPLVSDVDIDVNNFWSGQEDYGEDDSPTQSEPDESVQSDDTQYHWTGAYMCIAGLTKAGHVVGVLSFNRVRGC